MKYFWLVAFSTVLGVPFSHAASTDFPIARLRGLFTYQGHFEVSSLRKAETLSSETVEGQARIKQLRSEGYTCIRKNPTTRICSKTWTPAEKPQGLEASVEKFMKSIRVEFEGGSNPPQLTHDGSTQEWEVREVVKIIESSVPVYRVTRSSKGVVFLTFPINESQGLGSLRYENEKKLVLTVLANSHDSENSSENSTVSYTIEPRIEAQ
jgi:hypothetical protein